MKLVLFEAPSTGPTYGWLTPGGIVALDRVLTPDEPQAMLEQLIAEFDSLRPRIDALPCTALHDVKLLPPVPRPGKILVTTAAYGSEQKEQLLMTLKSPESVIGPGAIVRLPNVDPTWEFMPRAMLGLVIRGSARSVSADAWHTAVFGYTCVLDVMARGDQQFGRDYWLAKADTLGPLGPCIVTRDELRDPGGLRVRSWQNGEPAQDFSLRDASHSIAEQVEFATTVMTLHSGDMLACGASPLGLRPLGDADEVAVEIDEVGRLEVRVAAPVRSAA